MVLAAFAVAVAFAVHIAKLRLVQLLVYAARFQQLLMPAALGDDAVLEGEDLVSEKSERSFATVKNAPLSAITSTNFAIATSAETAILNQFVSLRSKR